MFDAIVVGTGPGGALAALRLAEAGARVLILEKMKLPRDKACGGAMTPPPVAALLDWDFSAFVEARIETMRYELDHARAIDRNAGGEAWLVNRRRFDLHIAERALAQGHGSVELRDGFAVAQVEEDDAGVTVVGKTGEQCRARFLIGADGAAGRVARAIGLGRRSRQPVALDAEIEVTPEVWAAEGRRMSFNFACLPGGYGWIFPKNGYLSCGVGSWSGHDRMPVALDAYLARALPPGSIHRQQRRGHPIPLYEGPARVSTQRICLVGDAAGLVDPIYGEGIRYALASGAIAAEWITACLAGSGPDDGTGYSRRIHTEIGAKLDRLRRFILPIFLSRPSTFYERFIEGGDSYSALARRLDALFPAAPVAIQHSAQC